MDEWLTCSRHVPHILAGNKVIFGPLPKPCKPVFMHSGDRPTVLAFTELIPPLYTSQGVILNPIASSMVARILRL